MGWTVVSLTTATGTRLEAFIDGLSEDAAAEAEALVEALAEHGNALRQPLSKALGNGLFEARGVTTGVRLFYIFARARRIVVLDGYLKKRTSIPAATMKQIRKLQRQAQHALEKTERERKKHDDKST